MYWLKLALSLHASLAGKVSLSSFLSALPVPSVKQEVGFFNVVSSNICAGWSKRIEYEPGTGSLALFPSMRLETCDEPITSIQATVELETNHIGKGCDRDTYSEKSIHRLCGKYASVMIKCLL